MLNLFIDHKAYKSNPKYAELCRFIDIHANNHEWDALHTTTDIDYFTEVGYETGGPVLYGYINWLHEQFKKDGIEKVFFLARDGQLMQRVYKELYDDLHCEYMYASRRALIVPTLWMDADLSNMQSMITFPMYLTIKSLLKRTGLDYHLVENEILKAGFNCQKLYSSKLLLKNEAFNELYKNSIKPLVVQNSRKQYELLLIYLKQLKFEGNVAIVDIGWFGRMQLALSRIIRDGQVPANIYGYYLGLKPESQLLSQMSAKGYLFDRNKNIENAEKEAAFNPVVENFFTANHGTTLGYQDKDGRVVPILEKWEYTLPQLQDDYKYIQSIQNGALAFVKDAVHNSKLKDIVKREDIAFLNWIQLGCYPSRECVNRYSRLHFEDNGVQSFIAYSDGKNYLFHPKMFLHDFIISGWRIGFLAKAFGTSVKCYEMYKWIRRLAHKAN